MRIKLEMRSRYCFIAVVIAVFVCIIFAYSLIIGEVNNELPKLEGKFLDLDAIVDSNNNIVNLNNYPQVLVHIYLPYCPACHHDQALLEKLNSNNCMPFIGLQWAGDLDTNSMTYNQFWIAKNSSVFVKLGMVTAPITLILNNNGLITQSHRGRLNEDVINKMLMSCNNK